MKTLDKAEKRVGGTDKYRQYARIAFEAGSSNKMGAISRLIVGDGMPDLINSLKKWTYSNE